VYKLLKEQGVNVRGVVRNASKAHDLLGCSRCDESEGIFIGDVADAPSLQAPMQGGGTLVIATSAVPMCDRSGCHFHKGGSPLDVDWVGARNQLEAFAKGTPSPHQGLIVLISTMGTTSPKSRFEKNMGHIVWYKLNFEAFLMASGIPFVIVKPCGLDDDEAGEKEILLGHEDDMLNFDPPLIARADVARLTVAALQNPSTSRGLRFDVCSKAGTPTSEADMKKLLETARYPWDRQTASSQMISEGPEVMHPIHAVRI